MSSEIHSSTAPAEEILSQVLSPEKRAELTDRLTKLKMTLAQVESKMAEESSQKTQQDTLEKIYVTEELNRRIEILKTIGAETRANISSVIQIQLTEKYHPSLQNMLKNIDKVNTAYEMILKGLTA